MFDRSDSAQIVSMLPIKLCIYYRCIYLGYQLKGCGTFAYKTNIRQLLTKMLTTIGTCTIFSNMQTKLLRTVIYQKHKHGHMSSNSKQKNHCMVYATINIPETNMTDNQRRPLNNKLLTLDRHMTNILKYFVQKCQQEIII